ncbi:MAG TPA: MFS transporter [Candidatus Agrococcus pullicola]|uniref:MFS transporter n=1 Tax=Candidatus Agrococcus pullicola TaxID=2838429 RepID=A0A9D1YX17_9MICO|nr:MFS transporter [Candidatus Agrococcus pullicola]
MTKQRAGSSTRADIRAWVGLGLLMVPVFMSALDMTVLFLAIPVIAAELLPSGTQQLWVLHIGDIAGASLVLTAGRLVDRFGPRLLLVLGIIAYGAASMLAAFAPSVEILIAARMLLGASAVTIAPAGLALLRRMFPVARQFSVALALFMAAFSGGMALGPPLGGVLLEHFWWGSIFLINVPVAIVVALLAGRLLPQIKGTGRGGIDIVSVLLSAAGIAAVVFGGQELAAGGWNAMHALVLALGLGLIVAFVRRQRALPDPLLDLRLFRAAPFTIALLSIWLVITATVGADLQFAQHLQVVIGHSPVVAGTLLVVPAVGSVLATAMSPLLLRWVRPGFAIGIGTLVGLAGAAGMFLTLARGPQAATATLIVAATVMATGIAPVFALGTNVMLANSPVEQTGSAQAMQEVSGSLGNTAGLAAGGTVAYLGYSSALRNTLPSGLDAELAQQSAQNIGGALAAARELPTALAVQLTDAAEDAFTSATRDTYLIAIAGLAVLAALAFWGLRKARVDNEPESQEQRRSADPGVGDLELCAVAGSGCPEGSDANPDARSSG